MGSRQVEIDFKFRPSEPLPRPDFETATTTTRISKFEPSAARLYFIFLSHFIMPLIWKKIWCDAGRVYGSTVFHATRRIPESERIWKDHFSSNRQTRGEKIYIKVRFFERSRTYPSFSVLTVHEGQHRRSPCILVRGHDCHLGRCWHGGKVLCIRGRPIKNAKLLLRVQSWDELIQPIVAQFYSTCVVDGLFAMLSDRVTQPWEVQRLSNHQT